LIPKKIHYCWFGPKPLPDLVKNCINSWKKNLPDYEIILWNESNSPMNVTFVQQAYNDKKYAFVSDYVRFWVLYNEGGIYLDTDMYVLKSLNDTLNTNCFLGWENKEETIINSAIIGAIKHHEFIHIIKKHYEHLEFDNENIPSLVVPRIISKLYTDYNKKTEISIYSYDTFYPLPYENKEDAKNFLRYRTKNTIAIHLWNISWGKKSAKIRDLILYYTKKLIKPRR
jgi:mannosyltransferase OCH1-like enzyme